MRAARGDDRIEASLSTLRPMSSVTLYSKISEVLAHRIASGSYAVGSAIPTEHELAEEFDASRHTIRAALRQLQDLGLISRRRGSGTIVQAQRANAGYSQSLSSLEDLVQLAARTPRTVHKMREIVMDTALAGLLNCAPGSHWLCISSTRGQPGQAPIVWTDLYVDAHYKGVRPLVNQHPDRLVSDLIETHYGRRIASVEQTIAGAAIPAAHAKALEIEPDAPGLMIVRHYRDQAGAVLLASVSYHPANRYKFSTTLIRQH